jgi:hypothetical protein
VIDDVAIGGFFQNKVPVTPVFNICWLEHEKDFTKDLKFPGCNQHQFHFRVKFTVAKNPYIDVCKCFLFFLFSALKNAFP